MQLPPPLPRRLQVSFEANFAVKAMNFVAKTMKFALQMMNVSFQMMNVFILFIKGHYVRAAQYTVSALFYSTRILKNIHIVH